MADNVGAKTPDLAAAAAAATPQHQQVRQQTRPTVSERERRRLGDTRYNRSETEDDDDDPVDEDVHDKAGDVGEDKEEYLEAKIVDSDVEALLVEGDSTDSNTDREPRAPRFRIDDEIDVTGLTEEQAKKKREEFRKHRARESRKKYSDRRKSFVKKTTQSAQKMFRIKSLQAVQDERGGIGNYIQVGDEFDSKQRLLLEVVVHHTSELAENYCLTINFPRNTTVDVNLHSLGCVRRL